MGPRRQATEAWPMHSGKTIDEDRTSIQHTRQEFIRKRDAKKMLYFMPAFFRSLPSLLSRRACLSQQTI